MLVAGAINITIPIIAIALLYVFSLEIQKARVLQVNFHWEVDLVPLPLNLAEILIMNKLSAISVGRSRLGPRTDWPYSVDHLRRDRSVAQ